MVKTANGVASNTEATNLEIPTLEEIATQIKEKIPELQSEEGISTLANAVYNGFKAIMKYPYKTHKKLELQVLTEKDGCRLSDRIHEQKLGRETQITYAYVDEIKFHVVPYFQTTALY